MGVSDREVTLHGHRVRYLEAGSGPPVVLIHGITSSAECWRPVIDGLARDHTVIAPDLLGHGASAKPRGDYSLGAYASGVRDLLAVLGHDHVTIVGHSLGGGIAMQFAYQFPERTARMVLVSSGGLGREVSILLRAATLPGVELVLPLIAPRWLGRVLGGVEAVGGRLGLRAGPDLAEMRRGYQSLTEARSRAAFVHTLRAVVDPLGQRVTGRDRLYLAANLPSLIVWGGRDPIIPPRHGRAAHEAMPGSEFVCFDDAGHFPQLSEPERFVAVLGDFLRRTAPAVLDPSTLRDRIRSGEQAATG